MTLKIMIQAAAIVYTVIGRYCASYLSHSVEYINWILITCSVQIIAVFSPEHSFVNTTPVKVPFLQCPDVNERPSDTRLAVCPQIICMCQCNVRASVIRVVFMVFAYFVNSLHYLYEWKSWYFTFHMKRHVPVLMNDIFGNICRHIGFLRIINLVHWVILLLDSCV